MENSPKQEEALQPQQTEHNTTQEAAAENAAAHDQNHQPHESSRDAAADGNHPHIVKPAKNKYPTVADILAIIGVFLVTQVLAGVVMGLLSTSGSTSKGFSIFLAYLFSFLITIVFALIQKWNKTNKRKPLLRLSFHAADPLISLWGLIVIVSVGIIIEPLLEAFPVKYFDMLNELMSAGGWMMFTSIILAPVMEEILFRGVIQESLTHKYGAITGIVVTSVIFGVIHINPPQALNAFFISLVLGYIYHRTQSLLPVMLIHAMNNAIAYFTYIINGDKTETLREMITNQTLYDIIYYTAVIVCIVAAVIMVMVIRRGEIARNNRLAGNNTNL